MNEVTKKFNQLVDAMMEAARDDARLNTLESAYAYGAAEDRAIAYERAYRDQIQYDLLNK